MLKLGVSFLGYGNSSRLGFRLKLSVIFQGEGLPLAFRATAEGWS